MDMTHDHGGNLWEYPEGECAGGAVQVEGIEPAKVADATPTATDLCLVGERGEACLHHAGLEVAGRPPPERLDAVGGCHVSELVGQRTTGQEQDLKVEVGVLPQPAQKVKKHDGRARPTRLVSDKKDAGPMFSCHSRRSHQTAVSHVSFSPRRTNQAATPTMKLALVLDVCRVASAPAPRFAPPARYRRTAEGRTVGIR